MAKTKISEFDTNPDNNTDINSINIAEGCAPSGINNAIRQLMSDLKEFQTGAASDPLTVGGVATFTAGSASAPAITTAGDTNTGIFFPAADTIAFSEGGTEAMRLDANGTVGVGVTPSSWNNYKAIQVGGGTSLAGWNSDGGTELSSNAFFQNQWNYIATARALRYQMTTTGEHRWLNAPSGTAGNAITFTQAMTLDASGNLLIGTTSPTYSTSGRGLVEINGASGALIAFKIGGTPITYWNTSTSAAEIGTVTNIPFSIFTNNAERMRIENSGDVAMGLTSSVDGARLTVRSKQSDFTGSALVVQNGNTSTLFRVYNSGTIVAALSSGAGTNTVKYNTSNGLVTYDTSSARYKDNIRDSIYGLDAVMQMRSTQFEYKDDGRSDVGLIAEELQPIIPELVGIDKEGRADSVSYDRMVSVLVKAIQELKAEVDSLKAQLENK